MINGGRSKVWIRYPIKKPSIVPTIRTSGITISGWICDFSIRLDVNIVEKPSMEPTERSIPPDIMTKVIPTLIISR
jgi:hypothetical protein